MTRRQVRQRRAQLRGVPAVDRRVLRGALSGPDAARALRRPTPRDRVRRRTSSSRPRSTSLATELIDYNAAAPRDLDVLPRPLHDASRSRSCTSTTGAARTSCRWPTSSPSRCPTTATRPTSRPRFARLLIQMSILKSLQTDGDKVRGEDRRAAAGHRAGVLPAGDRRSQSAPPQLRRGAQPVPPAAARGTASFKVLSEVDREAVRQDPEGADPARQGRQPVQGASARRHPGDQPRWIAALPRARGGRDLPGRAGRVRGPGAVRQPRQCRPCRRCAAELQALLQHTFHPIAARESSARTSIRRSTADDRQALAQFGKRLDDRDDRAPQRRLSGSGPAHPAARVAAAVRAAGRRHAVPGCSRRTPSSTR